LPHGLPEKSEGGGYNRRGEMSTFSTHRVPEAIFFRGNLVMTTIMEMANRRGWEKYQAGLWIMKSGEIGGTDQEIFSKGW